MALKDRIPPRFKLVLKRPLVLGRLIRGYVYDLRRFSSSSSSVTHLNARENLRARLTERYHSIEKGLSLRNPRPLFGRGPVGDVLDILDIYILRYGKDGATEAAVGALRKYVEFNLEAGPEAHQIPHASRVAALLASYGPGEAGGSIAMSRESVISAVAGLSEDFFKYRRSVRNFSEHPVEDAQIRFAASAAQNAPAVCNRQFARLRVFTNRAQVDRLLEIQEGARGFGSGVPALAVITADTSSYWGVAERNQAWIDGGLFAMNFITGLHVQGMGSVALNWSKVPSKDLEMRRYLRLADSEVIIMLVGFGHLREEFRVAKSPRLPLDECLVINPS